MALKVLVHYARILRRNATDAERFLWGRLCCGFLGRRRFRRQHAIGPFIVDFVCLRSMVIIELDGGHHAETIEADWQRDSWLREQGFEVLRFWNSDVFENIEGVLSVIEDVISRRERAFATTEF